MGGLHYQTDTQKLLMLLQEKNMPNDDQFEKLKIDTLKTMANKNNGNLFALEQISNSSIHLEIPEPTKTIDYESEERTEKNSFNSAQYTDFVRRGNFKLVCNISSNKIDLDPPYFIDVLSYLSS